MGKRKRFEELSERQKRTRLREQRSAVSQSFEVTANNQLTKDEHSLLQQAQHIGLEPVEDDHNVQSLFSMNDYVENENTIEPQARNTSVLSGDTEPIDDSSSGQRSNNIERTSEEQFANNLADCFKAINLSHCQANAILRVLKTQHFLSYLPSQSRTLLHSAKLSTKVINLDPGQYWHAGFSNVITSELSRQRYIPETLIIDISTDGASADQRGSVQFWPIQIRIVNLPSNRPMIVGVYRGKGKPSNVNDFFKCFTDEVEQVKTVGGILFRGQIIPIKFRAFIADAPARAYVLKHRGHNGTKPCSKCKVTGTRFREMRCRKVPTGTAFVGTEFQLRTNAEYICQSDEDHHLEGQSPLAGLINLVSHVPFEYMHLVCLGIMKKLFEAWFGGKFSLRAKLSARAINVICRRLEELAKLCPNEFQRQPRTATQYKNYKATEFRQFLLYTGPVVLQGILEEDYYLHFLLLHSSIRILVSPNPSQHHLKYAENALKLFVSSARRLYGASFLSYNLHGLLHLVGDVKNLGPLDCYSSFPFENNMPMFKKFVRTHYLHLQQFALRLMERNYLYPNKDDLWSDDVKPSMPHYGGLMPNNAPTPCGEYKQLQIGNTRYSILKRNNSCVLRDKRMCKIMNILENDGCFYFVIRQYHGLQQFYNCGITSDEVGIFKSVQLSTNLEVIPITNVISKCYVMKSWNTRNHYLSCRVPGEHVLVILLHHHSSQ